MMNPILKLINKYPRVLVGIWFGVAGGITTDFLQGGESVISLVVMSSFLSGVILSPLLVTKSPVSSKAAILAGILIAVCAIYLFNFIYTFLNILIRAGLHWAELSALPVKAAGATLLGLAFLNISIPVIAMGGLAGWTWSLYMKANVYEK